MGNLNPSLKIGKMESLFPRMELKSKSGYTINEEVKMEENLVGIEDFQKLDLRVAKVLEAEAVQVLPGF